MATKSEPRVNQSRFCFGCDLLSLELEAIAKARRGTA
jgi:hypothetical protein